MKDHMQISPATGCQSGAVSFLMIGAISLALLAAGLWIAKQSGESVDLQMRSELVRQAASIASAVGPVPVRELSFSDEDRGRPAFRLLCSQMAAYSEAAGLRSLYMMALRNGHLVFGPESLPEGDPYASSPGTVYKKPSERDFEIFYTGRPQVQGPAQDEYGTFVIASAPIIDPLNGEVLAVIGIDVAGADWQKVVRRAQWIPGGVTLVLIGILVLSAIFLHFRSRVAPSRLGKFSSAESVLSAIFMTSLTLALAFYLQWIEGNARRDTFYSLAQAQAAVYTGAFASLDAEMNHLKTFFESSETVTDDEFSLYCGENSGFAAIQNAFWIPEVAQESASRFADAVCAAGLSDFSIWQTNERGERETAGGRPFYYPVLYVHPAGSCAMTGYDTGSNPFLYDAIRRAKATGQNTATEPIAPGPQAQSDPLVYIFKPINASVQTGLLAFAVQPEKLPGGLPAKNLRSHNLEVCLSQLQAGHPPLLITGSSPACSDACWIKSRADLSLRVPVFAFDSTYALHFIPEPSWLADYPLTSGWRTGIGGMILTLLVTGLVALITNRRVALERLVEQRTGELKAGQQLLDGILNTIPARVFWKDKDLCYSGCNAAFARDAGLSTPHEIIGKDDYAMIWRNQAEVYRDDDRRVIESGIPKLLIEEPQTTPDGKTLTLLTSKIPLRDASGKICGVLGTYIDITDRKKAEQKITEQERYYRAIFSASMDAVFIADAETGQILDANPQAEKLIGRSRDEILQMNQVDLHPDPSAARRTFQTHMREVGDISRPKDGEVLHRDGTHIPVEINAGLVEIGGRTVAVGSFHDVRERMAAIEALRDSEEKFSKAFSGSPLLMSISELETGRYIEVNAAFVQNTGWTREEIIGRTSVEAGLITSKTRRKLVEVMKNAGRIQGFELEICNKQGEPVCCEYYGEIIRVAGQDRMLSIVIDVTERKRNQVILAQRTNLLQASARIAHILFRAENVDQSISAALAELGMASGQDRVYLFEYHQDEVSGENLMSQLYEWVAQGVSAQLHNPDLQNLSFDRYFTRWFNLLRGGSCVCGSVHTFPEEERAILLSQDIVSLLAVPLQIDGKFWGFIGLDNCRVEYPWSDVEIEALSGVANLIGVSIVRRRLAEQIEANKARLTVATQAAGIGVWDHDIVNDVLTWDDRMFELYGVRPEDFGRAYDAWQNGVHPEDRERAAAEVVAAGCGERPFDTEFRIVRPDGAVRYIKAVAQVLRDKDGRPLRMIGVNYDITEQKEAVERLRRSELRFRSYFELPLIGIAITSPEKGWISANEYLCGMLGYEEKELFGTTWAELTHPEDLAADIAQFNRLSAGEIERYGVEKRFVCKDGGVVWTTLSVGCVRKDDGSPDYFVALIQNISDRKQAEERMHQLARHLETVREEERKRLSRELHDDIGQILTALKIDLVTVEGDCACGKTVHNRMNDMQKLLSRGVQSVHSLCRQLRPGALDDLSLADAIEGLIFDWQQRNQTECKFCADLDDEALSDKIRTAVFRMVQEALTNVSRHAHASCVEINLVSDGATLQVSVADNGCGMEPGAPEKPASFGLLGMHERIEVLGGELQIVSSPGKGTRIDACFPLEGGGA